MSLSTGIPELDRRFADSCPAPASLLFFSDTLSEKRFLAEKFIVTGLQEGEVCLYVDYYRAPALVRADFGRMGEFNQEQLLLVDAVGRRLMVPTAEKYVIEDCRDVVSMKEVLESAVVDQDVRRVVVDSLEYLVDRLDKEEVVGFCRWLAELCSEAGATLVLLFTNWTFDDRELREFRRLVECSVEFRPADVGGIALNRMRIHESTKGQTGVSDWIPFSITDPLGFASRAPRILVLGGPQTGKGTFLRALEPRNVVIEAIDDNGGSSCQKLQMSAIGLEGFGMSRDAGLSMAIEVFVKEVDGVILLVDSSNPESVKGSRNTLAIVGDGVPVVVVANKQDVPGAMKVEEVATTIGAGSEVPVLGAVSTISNGVWEAVDTLLGMVMSESQYRWFREARPDDS